jgi:hypothetical protein
MIGVYFGLSGDHETLHPYCFMAKLLPSWYAHEHPLVIILNNLIKSFISERMTIDFS